MDHHRFVQFDIEPARRQNSAAKSRAQRSEFSETIQAASNNLPCAVENFTCVVGQISGFRSLHPAPARGTLRPIVTKRGAGCDGCGGITRRKMRVADGEIVWS
jgi:hypothetical protein